MHFVYILRSLKDGRYYIGSTTNVQARLIKHNAGGNVSTKHRRPFVVVWQEECSDRSSALRRENEIKKMKGGIQFKKLLQHIQ